MGIGGSRRLSLPCPLRSQLPNQMCPMWGTWTGPLKGLTAKAQIPKTTDGDGPNCTGK